MAEEQVKVWKVFSAARYIDGKCQESIEMSHMSGGQPNMVSVNDYIAMRERAEDAEARLAALYQVIGALAGYAGVFETDDVENALDVASGQGDVDKLQSWPKDVERFVELEKKVSDV